MIEYIKKRLRFGQKIVKTCINSRKKIVLSAILKYKLKRNKCMGKTLIP